MSTDNIGVLCATLEDVRIDVESIEISERAQKKYRINNRPPIKTEIDQIGLQDRFNESLANVLFNEINDMNLVQQRFAQGRLMMISGQEQAVVYEELASKVTVQHPEGDHVRQVDPGGWRLTSTELKKWQKRLSAPCGFGAVERGVSDNKEERRWQCFSQLRIPSGGEVLHEVSCAVERYTRGAASVRGEVSPMNITPNRPHSGTRMQLVLYSSVTLRLKRMVQY